MQHVSSTLQLGFISFLLLLLSACGNADRDLASLPSPSSQVASQTSQYPAIVKVVAPGGAGLCTGTFVSERAVLTAAHCTLRAGTYAIISSFGTFYSNQIANFGPGIVDDPNDVALIVFNSDIADRSKNQVLDMSNQVSEGETLRLVGFGCNNMQTKTGAGVKRTGTNMVYEINDYINFVTPQNTIGRGILGSENRAGSCFGDSGGPALHEINGQLTVAGVAHAGGSDGVNHYSEYSDVASRSDNRNFLSNLNDSYGLNIQGL